MSYYEWQRVICRFDFTLIRRRVEKGCYYWTVNQVRHQQLAQYKCKSRRYFSHLALEVSQCWRA
jgi:hypothetical protein